MLKMDCEGCEYGLLKEKDSTIKRMKKIQLEYLFGPRSLKERPERAEMKVSYSRRRDLPNNRNVGRDAEGGRSGVLI